MEKAYKIARVRIGKNRWNKKYEIRQQLFFSKEKLKF